MDIALAPHVTAALAFNDDALSISAAACDAGSSIGLRTAERTYTFAELARLAHGIRDRLPRRVVPGGPVPVIGANTVETALTLYALLEARIPALLLHPRLTASERKDILRATAAAGPLDVLDAACVVHTSGTTGVPRAAVLTRAALAASARASEANIGWHANDCWLLAMPLAHVGGLSILTRCLMARRAVALSTFDVAGFPAELDALRVTLASLVPTMLQLVLDAHPLWRASPRLRAVLLGGAPARERLLEAAAQRNLPVLVTYGLTETCSQITTTPYALRYAPGAHGSGLPLPGIDVRVRDGNIEVRGPVLMHGYRNEPPLGSDAWFATGDLGGLDGDGSLHVHARRHDLIITGGENVYPVEVERALERCAGITAAAVFGIADATWGQVVAALLVGDSRVLQDGTLRHYLDGALAPHKRPRRIVFTARLPYTRAGKLDREAVRAFAAQTTPL